MQRAFAKAGKHIMNEATSIFGRIDSCTVAGVGGNSVSVARQAEGCSQSVAQRGESCLKAGKIMLLAWYIIMHHRAVFVSQE